MMDRSEVESPLSTGTSPAVAVMVGIVFDDDFLLCWGARPFTDENVHNNCNNQRPLYIADFRSQFYPTVVAVTTSKPASNRTNFYCRSSAKFLLSNEWSRSGASPIADFQEF
mmetsp:Transcript_18785/g.52484  ORF Transcript_18785/g.52484 Transcript_18785/m.52484 type:complete len:112 (+) Transcript_18785:1288-1623(+)